MIKHIAVGVFIIALCVSVIADDGYSIIKPHRIGEFITGSDSLVLYCTPTDIGCPLARSVLKATIASGIQNMDIEGDLKLGYMDSMYLVAITKGLGSARGREFVYYQHGVVHNTIPAELMTNVDQLTKWLEMSSKDLLTEYTSMEEFNEEVKSCAGEFSTIVYFSDNQNPELDRELLQLHLKYDSIFQVKAMRKPALISAAGESLGTIKVFQCYDNTLSKEFTRVIDDDLNALTEWILHRGTPLVVKASEMTTRRAHLLFGLCVVVAIPEEEIDSMLPILTKVAKQRTVGFVYENSTNIQSWVEDAGGSGNVFPTAFAVHDPLEPPVAWDEKKKITESSLIAWIDQIQDGTVEPFRVSEAIPPPSKDALKPLVYDNFLDTVSHGDNVVMFYGKYNRCPECYSALYAFRLTAEAKKFRGLSFYQYDISKNYLTQPLSRMPDIFLYKSSGDVIRFPDEPYTKKHFEKWLQKYFPIKKDEL